MATSVSLGFPLWTDGSTWTSLLSRQFDGGVSIWDSNASLTAVSPLGGVFHGPGSPLLTAQQASPAMSVLVNAGYVAVPHPTAGHGVYLFGLQDQSTLTIASNGTGSSRLDLIVARVNDLGNSSSTCDIEVVQGTAGNGQPATPSASFLLAVVTIAPATTSIVTADIADKRSFTCSPGGILATSTADAPPLADGQVVWNTSLSLLERLANPVTFTQTWDAEGTYSWTFPDGVSSVAAQGTGAGASGGGTDSSNVGAGGAGAGEWAADTITGTPGVTVLTITVGAGGPACGPGTNSTSAGGTTTVTGGSAELEANGGQPGQSGGTPGLGGTGSTNAEHNDGGPGGEGVTGLDAGGGGGSSGGPGSPGLAGGSGNPEGRGGRGASAVPGGGPGGQGGSYEGDGFAPATGPGGGGGGTSGSGNSSGAGSDGAVTFTWVVQPAVMTPVFSTDSGEEDLAVVGTSTGAAGSSGLTPASGSAFGWGIGYGSTTYSGGGGFGFFGFGGGSGFDADGSVVPQIQATFDADGQTDFQIDVKWCLAVPEAAVDASSPSIAKGQCRIIIMLDSTILDTVYLCCSASGGTTHPGDGGCFTYYTSGQRGTTPSAGMHTATLAVETQNTLSGQLSGAHIGNLASVGTSSHPFSGALASYFTTALTAENCSLRVAGILASSI